MQTSSTPPPRLIAVCGKGGTGKTVLTAMMAKVLSQSDRGLKVLLVDGDPAMGLPSALGVKVGRTIGEIREEVIRTARRGNREETLEIANVLDYMVLDALCEMGSYSLLVMGRTESVGCFCPVNDLLRGAIEALSSSFDLILIDGEAGLEQINRKVVRRLDTLLVVTDATARGMQTAALIKKMVEVDKVIECELIGLVFNRAREGQDFIERSAKEMGLELLARIPEDANIASYDLQGKPIVELPDSSPSVAAVKKLVEAVFAGIMHSGG
ncbi:MAG: ATP-binding protein [Dehalococcoidia bacterium]